MIVSAAPPKPVAKGGSGAPREPVQLRAESLRFIQEFKKNPNPPDGRNLFIAIRNDENHVAVAVQDDEALAMRSSGGNTLEEYIASGSEKGALALLLSKPKVKPEILKLAIAQVVVAKRLINDNRIDLLSSPINANEIAIEGILERHHESLSRELVGFLGKIFRDPKVRSALGRGRNGMKKVSILKRLNRDDPQTTVDRYYAEFAESHGSQGVLKERRTSRSVLIYLVRS